MTDSVLDVLLTAREKRRDRIDSLMREYGMNVIVITLNIPGRNKFPPWAAKVLKEAIRVVTEICSEIAGGFRQQKLCKYPAGYEWYALIPGNGTEIKQLTIRIEESHSLGRLFDIDVHSVTGKPLDRASLGFAPRRCFVCERPAHECGRSRRHSINVLMASINSLIESLFLGEDRA